ncbi:MAG TPA: sensor histidine kinase [Promineifilum sp.]|nr:sensor histidine kinase [Promineifilum sp.]
MRETERITSPLSLASATKADDATPRLMRLARALAAVVIVVMALNFVMVVWYVVRTGDTTSFLSHQMMTPFLSIIYTGLGVVIIKHRPRNPIGWIFLIVSSSYVLSALAAGALLYTSILPAPLGPLLLDLATWLGNWAWLPAQLLPLTFVFLLFPDGRLLSPRWRIIGWAAGLGLLSLMLGLAAHPGPIADWASQPNPFGIAGAERALDSLMTVGSFLLAIGVFGSMAAIAVRFRRSKGIERARMKWLVYAAILILIAGAFTLPYWLSGNLSNGLALELSIVLTNLVTLGIAVAVTIAIVGYRLYDIDVIINRTLVYSVMTGVIILIYSLVVGTASVLFGSSGNWLLALVATGLVAVLFQPIRDRLQRGVNRLLYGQRDEPFEVLTRLGQSLEQSAADTALPALVDTVAQALRLPYVDLQERQGDRFVTVAATGRPVDDPVSFPMIYQAEEIGRLLVGSRTPGETLGAADEHLLRNIARQAGATVYDTRLTADLQRSRQQIVASREEERRRLRRDLHDGLGPSLASLLLEARVLRRMIREDPAAAEGLADEIQADIRATIDDVRRVVNELRPPALDDLGLVPALQVMAAKLGRSDGQGAPGLSVQVDAPADLPSLPAAVEVAAYRIVQEGLANVLHHAQARQAVVRIRVNGDLRVEVWDDGAGFQTRRRGGVGLISMRERAAELGGRCEISSTPGAGTLITATLPINELQP